MTTLTCPRRAGDVETTFLAALERVTGWRLDGEELVLDEDGEELLRFKAGRS